MQNNSKIACLGCSWTEGVEKNSEPLNHKDTYPHILNQWLINSGHDNIMYNAGRAGAGIEYYHFVADYLLKNYDPDIFVIQITTHDRTILVLDPIDEKEKQMNFGIDQYGNTYHKIWDNNMSFVHLSPGLGAGASEHGDIKTWAWFVEHLWKSRIDNKVVPPLSFEAFKSYLATWYEQSKDSYHQTYFYYQQTYSLIDYLESLGKKVIPFYWLNYKPQLKTKLFPVRQFPSVENLFDNKTFKSLQIDNGYHFGKDGNARLVQEFLGPQVLETMK
jgi:hypothetical protein|tara:strand:+ start:2941 stop:3762 length:822 start_codon:yes stop_codon:yes gene_type:complete